MGYCRQDIDIGANRQYHDEEWGVPLHDDRKNFEFLVMEVLQCGLSWHLVMQRREVFRACFSNFDYNLIAQYDESDISRIMQTPNMIRSERKIKAIISNARNFIRIREKYSSFSAFLWKYSGGKTILYDKHSDGFIPASNGLSDKISRDLKKWNFSFLGSVTIYSHLQACGMINDHDKSCPMYQKIIDTYPTVHKRRYLEKDIHYYGG